MPSNLVVVIYIISTVHRSAMLLIQNQVGWETFAKSGVIVLGISYTLSWVEQMVGTISPLTTIRQGQEQALMSR